MEKILNYKILKIFSNKRSDNSLYKVCKIKIKFAQFINFANKQNIFNELIHFHTCPVAKDPEWTKRFMVELLSW